jgi:hypothetical protein
MNIKLSRIVACAAFLVLCAMPASAQSFDLYGSTRKLVMSTVSCGPAATVTAASNNCVDIHAFTGIITVDIFSSTNDNSSGNTFTLETSSNTTNWTALANFAVGNPTAALFTNLYVSTIPVWVTNNYNLPGTNTTPTASTAGFASPYLITSPFTNAGAISMNTGFYTVAFRADDQPRYFHIKFALSGTNACAGAVITGRPAQPYGPF